MNKTQRVFLIVLDSVGAGALPDAAEYGDAGSNTLKSVNASPALHIETLKRLGIGNIEGLHFLGNEPSPAAAFARLAERSKGKDTTTGHWEIAGVISQQPMPTYPHGFPEDVIAAFSAACGRGVLCNRPYSGTEVIKDYGKQHMETGDLIVYTSADSVFQIAAHEDVVPLDELYRYCRLARGILTGEHSVGRVIARPFTGVYPSFTRTPNRKDFSLEPPKQTLLDVLSQANYDVIAVGKISDIFAGRGVTKAVIAHGNSDGTRATQALAGEDFHGLCFVNLVDFDMKYGHRNDVDGYAGALTEFDLWLKGFLPLLHEDDMLMITADHGCDPGTKSTDHSREYIPLLVYGAGVKPVALGTRNSFSDIGATVAEIFGVPLETQGQSFLREIET